MPELTSYVGFTLTQHEKEVLDVIAKIKNMTLSDVMREIVKQHIENIKRGKD